MKDKRVAIYVRVSTQDQNLDQQEEELNRYCEVRNWSNVTIYRDKVSGTKSSREGQRNFFSVNWSSDIRRLGANCRTAC